MSRLADRLTPSEAFQVILKRKGKPVLGLYSDDKQEIRSPALDSKRNDVQLDRKNS